MKLFRITRKANSFEELREVLVFATDASMARRAVVRHLQLKTCKHGCLGGWNCPDEWMSSKRSTCKEVQIPPDRANARIIAKLKG